MIREDSHSPIGSRRQVALYPSFATPLPNGEGWLIRVQGCVFEPGTVNLRKRIMLRLLQKVMRADPSALDSEIFRARIAGFVASPEKGLKLTAQVGDRCYPLRKKSKRNGQFGAVLHLTREELDAIEGDSQQSRWISIRIQASPEENVLQSGRIQLLEERGQSVISDIDDTIKHTQVCSRRIMLANTFLREFSAIDGMAALYSGWHQQGAAFHYVSSSPWQLFQPLYDHCHEAGFPDGSMHLRSFRLRDHMLRRLLLIRRSGKAATIRKILETFPKREFTLVGDSGEKDPEIYARLALQFPQVRAVLIRDLAERPMTPARRLKVFKRLSDSRWQIYQHANELSPQLSDAVRGNSQLSTV